MVVLISALIVLFCVDAAILLLIRFLARVPKNRNVLIAFVQFAGFLPVSYICTILITDLGFLRRTPEIEALTWTTIAFLVAGMWLTNNLTFRMLIFLLVSFSYYLKTGVILLSADLSIILIIGLSAIAMVVFASFLLASPNAAAGLSLLMHRPHMMLFTVPTPFNFSTDNLIKVSRNNLLISSLVFASITLLLALVSVSTFGLLSVWNLPLLAVAFIFIFTIVNFFNQFGRVTIGQSSAIQREDMQQKTTRVASVSLIVGMLIAWVDPLVLANPIVLFAPFVGIAIGTFILLFIWSRESMIGEAVEKSSFKIHKAFVKNLIMALPDEVREKFLQRYVELDKGIGEFVNQNTQNALDDLERDVMEKVSKESDPMQEADMRLLSMQIEAQKVGTQANQELDILPILGLSYGNLIEEIRRFQNRIESAVKISRTPNASTKTIDDLVKDLEFDFGKLKARVDRTKQAPSESFHQKGDEFFTIWVPKQVSGEDLATFAFKTPHDIERMSIKFEVNGFAEVQKALFERSGNIWSGVLTPDSRSLKHAVVRCEAELVDQSDVEKSRTFDTGKIFVQVVPPQSSIDLLQEPIMISGPVGLVAIFVLSQLGLSMDRASLIGGAIAAALVFTIYGFRFLRTRLVRRNIRHHFGDG